MQIVDSYEVLNINFHLRFKKQKENFILKYISFKVYTLSTSIYELTQFYEHTHIRGSKVRLSAWLACYAGRQNNQLRVALRGRWNRGWPDVVAVVAERKGKGECGRQREENAGGRRYSSGVATARA